MYHFSFYNQLIPLIIANPQLFVTQLNLYHQLQQYYAPSLPNPPPRRVRHNKKKSKPANKTISNGKQIEVQRTVLKAGLQKSIDSNNKGFEILKKMGYEEGKPLGKGGCGITEPLRIPLKEKPRDRAGFGQETEVTIKKEILAEEEVRSVKKSPKITPPPKVVTAPKIKKEKPSAAPGTKREKQLHRLTMQHSEDIELLRLRLQAELSVQSKDNDTMIIAQVAITGEAICQEVFEIIHQYLVNSLHVYTGIPYPMFHDIAHVDDEIKVVCEDLPSFEYLSSCITALSTNLSLPMTTQRISPVGGNVYWFAVQMQGLVSGPQSFLMQIKKHRFGLRPDRWIIVTQQPCANTNKTNLQIITDEHSAMMLIYRHSLKLFVCMQEMDFALRGKIPFAN